MTPKVCVALVWHMHQPEYRDPATGVASLPWVRLHAAKDYVDMAAIAGRFPDLRVTFNLAPILLEQLDAVAAGEPEVYADLAAKPAAALSPEERLFLLRYSFMTSWERHVHPHDRYRELLDRRGRVAPEDVSAVTVGRFTDADLTDLQTLFNLAWTDRHWDEGRPWLTALRQQERDYTAGDLARVLALHREIAAATAPAYRALAESGVAELSTTPYYHPIGPLLLDQAAAREARPEMVLPEHRFAGRRDLEWHVDRAVAEHARRFGQPPVGMWPAEGGVGDAFAETVAARGIRWIASDEEVLRATLGRAGKTGDPWGPWNAGSADHPVAVFFREHYLSDLVGFVYSRWPADRAAADFLARIKAAGEHAGGEPGRPPLVTIILDGENPWESYDDDGRPFLEALYGAITRDPGVESVTPSGYLQRYPCRRHAGKLVAGSWINHDFGVWIGHAEDRRAWDLLAQAREALLGAESRLAPEAFARGWKHLMAAEGSDWCWWYGEEHYTPIAHEFDRLFRSHLIRIHEIVAGEAPPALLNPIKGRHEEVAFRTPRDRLKVVVDGRPTTYFEWLAAGRFTPSEAASEMHRAASVVSAIRFGIAEGGGLCVRLDATQHREVLAAAVVEIEVVHPIAGTVVLAPGTGPLTAAWTPAEGPGGHPAADIQAAHETVLEAVIRQPGGDPDAGWSFSVLLRDPAAGSVLERWPATGHLPVEPPAKEADAADWVV